MWLLELCFFPVSMCWLHKMTLICQTTKLTSSEVNLLFNNNNTRLANSYLLAGAVYTSSAHRCLVGIDSFTKVA